MTTYNNAKELTGLIELTIQRDENLAQMYFQDTVTWYTSHIYTTGDLDLGDSLECFDLSTFTEKMYRDVAITFMDGTFKEFCHEHNGDEWSDVAHDYLMQYSVGELEGMGTIDYLREYAKYTSTTIRGYSQGDYATVYQPKGEELTDKHLTNLFYDQPLYIIVEKDGETYYLDETLDDTYVYDRAQILKGAENYPQDIQDFLKNNLPEEFI
ncbi:MAG: hypothetical protein GY928_16025 [Colwellia sp.]|nr:hypothetical protein [Colwellia sp.]